MKINDSLKQSVDISTNKPSIKSEKSTGKSSVGPASSETVTLSSLSSQLKSLEAKVSSTEDFDAAKVDEIKSAISGGQFKVDSSKVADGLISSVQDFLNTQKP